MSTRSIDERIVDMQFNNKQFEEGIRDSLTSLDNLQKTVSNIDGSSKGLEELGAATGRLGIDFGILEVAAITALAKIASAALDFGVQIAKSLTITPILDGFKEYEQKMKSVQTIMVNTAKDGTTMDEVVKVLDELNEYADHTVFSFADMTTAIGRLTASGVKLDDAAGAIKGISNVAAGMGGSLQNANTAFIQLGQSIAGGRLELQDWKSVVAAGVGGPYLQNELMAAAVAAGEMDQALMDAVQNGERSFITLIRAAGAAGPEVAISSDSILKALNKLAEDDLLLKAATEVKSYTQLMETVAESVGSSWAKTWELIIGNKDEATEVWTAVNDAINSVIDPMNNLRNDVLELWQDLGGRNVLLEGLGNIGQAILQVIELVSNAWERIFPPMTGEKLLQLTEGFLKLTEHLGFTEEAAAKIESVLSGVFAIIGIIADVLGVFVGAIAGVLGAISPFAEGLLDVSANAGEFLVALRESGVIVEFMEGVLRKIGEILGAVGFAIGETAKLIGRAFTEITDIDLSDIEGFVQRIPDMFNRAFENVSGIIKWIGEKISEAVGFVRDYFGQFSGIDLGPLRMFVDNVETQFRPFTFIADIFKGALDMILGVWENVKPYLQAIGDFFGPMFSKIIDGFKEFASSFGINSLADVLSPAVLAFIAKGVSDFFKTLSSAVEDTFSMFQNLASILDGVKDVLKAWQTELQSKALLNIAIAIGILAAALLVISTIDGNMIAAGLGAITVLFSELAGVMIVLSKGMGSVKLTSVATGMVLISTAVLILAQAVKSLSQLSWEDMGKGLVGVGVLLAELAGFAKLIDAKSILAAGAAMIPLATGIVILAGALHIIAALTWEELARGLVGLAGALAAIGLASKLISPGTLLAMGVSLVGVGAGVAAIAGAFHIMAALSWEEIGKGLVGMAGALVAVAVGSKLISPGTLIAMGLALVGVGAGVAVIAASFHIMAALSWEEIGKGLVGMAGALIILGAATKMINPVTLIGMGVGLTAVGVALNLIGASMKISASMSWEEIGKGMVVMAGAITILTVACKAIGVTGIVGAAALTLLAIALALLVPSIVILGMMDMENIGHALLVLAGVFVIFGAAALLLSGLTLPMIALAGAIALFGAGIALLGVGLLAASIALTTFAAAGAATVAMLVYLIESVVGLIPTVIVAIGEGLLALLQLVVDAIPMIVDSVVAIGEGILKVFVELVPAIIDAIVTLLTALLDAIVEFTPKLIDGIFVLLTALLEEVVEFAPKLIDAIFVILDSILTNLIEFVPKIVDAGIQLLLGFLEGVSKNIQEVVTLALKIMSEFLSGIAAGLPGVMKSAVDIVVVFLDSLGKELPRIIDAGFKMIVDFVNGLADAIRENTGTLVDAFWNLASAMVEGLIDGIFAGVKGAVDAVKSLGDSIVQGFKDLLGIKSPSTVMLDAAGDMVDGLTIGLMDGITAAAQAGEALGAAAKDGVESNQSSAELLGDQYGEDFTTSLASYESDSLDSGSLLSQMAEQGVLANAESFNQNGTMFGEDFVSGLTSNESDSESAGSSLSAMARLGLSSDNEEYGLAGSSYGMDFASGISSSASEAETAAGTVAASAQTGLASKNEDISQSGKSAGEGFIEGLRSLIDAAASVGRRLADAVSGTINKVLNIKSPSRVLEDSGENAGQGFVNGLLAMIGSVDDVSNDMGDAVVEGLGAAINAISDAVSGDIDLNPVITPVLDLSNIQNGSKALEEMLSGTTIDSKVTANVDRIADRMKPETEDNIKLLPGEPKNKEPMVSLVQNNYSPKSLSRLELYRQTRNQLNQVKELVKDV